MKVISRNDARELNLSRYFTGKSCKHGHIAERYTSTATCLICNDTRKKKYYQDNKESCIESNRKWQKENKELVAKYSRDWHHKNPEYGLEMSNQRRAAKNLATPSWYEGEKDDIIELYQEAKQLTNITGIPRHVDHIIPLRGEKVCGLHCLANLQILTGTENITKSNNFNLLAESSR